MSEQQNEIEVFQSNLFEKQLKKLSTNKLTVVEKDFCIIISSPEAGERKKSDLAYLVGPQVQDEQPTGLLGRLSADRETPS